jgi:hypothetical protein
MNSDRIIEQEHKSGFCILVLAVKWVFYQVAGKQVFSSCLFFGFFPWQPV